MKVIVHVVQSLPQLLNLYAYTKSKLVTQITLTVENNELGSTQGTGKETDSLHTPLPHPPRIKTRYEVLFSVL